MLCRKDRVGAIVDLLCTKPAGSEQTLGIDAERVEGSIVIDCIGVLGSCLFLHLLVNICYLG